MLNLDRHCIETEIKRTYNDVLSKYFKSKGMDADLENRLKILENALRQFDFCHLRSTYQELCGGSTARVTLMEDADNIPILKIDGRVVFPI